MSLTLTLERYDCAPELAEEEMSVGSVWQELMQSIDLARNSMRNGAIELAELHAERAWEMYLSFRGGLDVYSGHKLAADMRSLADDTGVDVSGLLGWLNAPRSTMGLAA